MGKTLTFWLPLLFRLQGSMQLIITPLNLLGKQNAAALNKAGLRGIAISAESATLENFRVSIALYEHFLLTNKTRILQISDIKLLL